MLSDHMLISSDTGVIIRCIFDEEFLNGVKEEWKRNGNSFVMSSMAEGESIRKLVRTWKWNKDRAMAEVRSIILELGMKRKFKQEIDVIEGFKLTKKYGKDENNRDYCHPPDNIIIAHIKRLRVNLVLTCDEKFATICEKEGIRTRLYWPKN